MIDHMYSNLLEVKPSTFDAYLTIAKEMFINIRFTNLKHGRKWYFLNYKYPLFFIKTDEIETEDYGKLRHFFVDKTIKKEIDDHIGYTLGQPINSFDKTIICMIKNML